MPAILPLHLEEIEGRVLLFALDLPGCWAEGRTEAEALEEVPAALAAYRAWRAGLGDAVPDQVGQPCVVERIPGRFLPDGSEVNALFAPERRPPDGALLGLCRRLLERSGEDLVAAMAAIPADRWDAVPVGDRTPRQTIAHVAQAELWYLGRFTHAPRPLLTDHPSGSPEQFAAVHAALLGWLETAAPNQLGQVIVEREEEWTVRKLLRRALWHERTHTADLRRTIGHRPSGIGLGPRVSGLGYRSPAGRRDGGRRVGTDVGGSRGGSAGRPSMCGGSDARDGAPRRVSSVRSRARGS